MNIVKIWLVTLILIVVTYSLHYFRSVFSLFFIAMVIAYILNPSVQLIQRKTRNLLYRDHKTRRAYRWIAVAVVLFFFFIILLVGFDSLRSLIVDQLLALLNDMPQIRAGFQGIVQDLEQELRTLDLPTSIIQPIQDFITEINQYVSGFVLRMLSSIARMTTHVLDMVLVIILLVYFMIYGEKIFESLHQFLIQNRLNRISRFVRDSNRMIWVYIKTRIIISAAMGLTVYLGLRIGQIRYAGMFALMCFLLDFIPYFGSIVGGIVIVVYSLITYDVACAVKVAIFILVVQQIEGNFVVPKVQGDQVKVHPLLILLAILLSNEIWGPGGMLFAVPLAAMGRQIFSLVVEFLLTPSGDIRRFLSEEPPAEEGVETDEPAEEEQETPETEEGE